MTPVNSFGWVDDGTESGRIRVYSRNNLVSYPFRKDFITLSGFSFYDGYLGLGNPDGSGSCCSAVSIPAMPAGAASTEFSIQTRVRGTVVGVRFDPTYNVSGDSTYADFDLIIDGVAYKVIRKRFLETGAVITNFAREASFVVSGLLDTEHAVRIEATAIPTLRSDHRIWGLVVDRNAGYEEMPHVPSSTNPATLTTAYQSLTTLWANPENLGRGLESLVFVNTSVGTVTVYAQNTTTSKVVAQHDVAAGDTWVLDVDGLAGATSGALQVKASANTSVNVTATFKC